jgi:hypothetical protein
MSGRRSAEEVLAKKKEHRAGLYCNNSSKPSPCSLSSYKFVHGRSLSYVKLGTQESNIKHLTATIKTVRRLRLFNHSIFVLFISISPPFFPFPG